MIRSALVLSLVVVVAVLGCGGRGNGNNASTASASSSGTASGANADDRGAEGGQLGGGCTDTNVEGVIVAHASGSSWNCIRIRALLLLRESQLRRRLHGLGAV